MIYPFTYICLTRTCNTFKESRKAIPDMPLYCSVCEKKQDDKATALTAQKIINEDKKRKKNRQGALMYNRRKKINKQK
jgi:hypothetical protein